MQGSLSEEMRSDEDPAAVDVQDVAGDEGGPVGGQEGHGVGDLAVVPSRPAGTRLTRSSRMLGLAR